MATSGTVSTTVFNTRKVIDHAFRRCRLTPQQITSEHIQTALDLLYLDMSTLGNRGIPLWTIEKIILPIYERVGAVPTPLGTIDAFDINLRVNQRVYGANSSSAGVANNAFDGDLDTACTQASAGGWIQTMFESQTAIPIFGILPNATGSWDFSLQYSDDGVTWTNIFTQTSLSVVAGEWYWVDVEGVMPHPYYRLQANGTTALNVTELVFQNAPQEIPCYKLNRTDYNNLPDKARTGRPTQFWYDKQRLRPILHLWPSPQSEFTFAQITGYIHRQIQDVGTMTQEVEVPQRWKLAIVTGLAKQLAREIKEVDPALIPQIDADASEELYKAWSGEGDGSASTLAPNISPYTR